MDRQFSHFSSLDHSKDHHYIYKARHIKYEQRRLLHRLLFVHLHCYDITQLSFTQRLNSNLGNVAKIMITEIIIMTVIDGLKWTYSIIVQISYIINIFVAAFRMADESAAECLFDRLRQHQQRAPDATEVARAITARINSRLTSHGKANHNNQLQPANSKLLYQFTLTVKRNMVIKRACQRRFIEKP